MHKKKQLKRKKKAKGHFWNKNKFQGAQAKMMVHLATPTCYSCIVYGPGV